MIRRIGNWKGRVSGQLIEPRKNTENAIKKIVSSIENHGFSVNVSPQIKNIKASGYSNGGASSRKGSTKAFFPVKSSPQADIDMNLDLLRARASDLAINTPLGQAAIDTSVTNVVGAGLHVSPLPDMRILGLTSEEARDWSRTTAFEFDRWASSKSVDYTSTSNFYEMQDIAYRTYMIDGDSFCVIQRGDIDPLHDYTLRLQIVEGARVCNPDQSTEGVPKWFKSGVITKNVENGNRIVDGVEIDDTGSPVAYWICNSYLYNPAPINDSTEWVRVEAHGDSTGTPNVLQIMHGLRPEQYRGVPYLAPVIESLKQLERYTNSEISAALIRSCFSIFFVEETYHNVQGPNGFPIAPVNTPGNSAGGENYVMTKEDCNQYALGPGVFGVVPPGYKPVSISSSNTSLAQFQEFTKCIEQQIGSALGIPYEVLMKSFTSSYTAGRAALLQANTGFKTRREWFIDDFPQPIYNLWLSEAVASGRVKAPGFFTDPSLRQAWCKCEWYGPVMGILDPQKEVQAGALRVLYGFSNRSKESMELSGVSFDSNLQINAMDNEELTKLGIPTYPNTGKGNYTDFPNNDVNEQNDSATTPVDNNPNSIDDDDSDDDMKGGVK